MKCGSIPCKEKRDSSLLQNIKKMGCEDYRISYGLGKTDYLRGGKTAGAIS
jgi:hypothetical protein